MAGGTGFGRWTGAPANLFAHTRHHVRPPVSGILRTEAAGVTGPLAACPVGELIHRPDVAAGSSGLKVRGDGRLTKEWMTVGPAFDDGWLPLAAEALAFVGSRG